MAEHRLIDADTHVNEPPGLWVDRVPDRYRDLVPRVQRFEQGDAWVMEGVKDPINFGLNAAATLPKTDRKPWVFFEDIPSGGWDPSVRLEEMDVDMVDAAVLYPTPRLSQCVIATPDPDLHLAMVRAYNDWLAEYASHEPTRLGGIALVPNRGVEQAVAEIERVARMPGIVGLLVGLYPHGDKDLAPEDDPVWEAAVEAGLPLHVHVKLVDTYPEDIYAPGRMTQGRAEGDLRFLQAPTIMVQFLNSGVLDRVPGLQLAFVEVDAGWVPYVREQLDNRFRRRTVGPKARLAKTPGEYIHDHFWFTYLTDHYAVRNRHAVGVDRLMWSSDFPHSGSDWPDSWVTIDADYFDVPRAERDLILAGNAQSLYRFGQGAMKESDLQFLVAASRRILAREGCESRVAGHVSARVEGEDAFWVSPFGYFDETTPDMVIKLSFELDRLEGEWEPSPAVEFHAAIYRARPDVGSVIHTHSHHLSKFVTRPITIGMYNVAAVLFHDEQVLFDREDMKNNTMGGGMVRMLGDKRVLLMKNHGAVVCSETVEQATIEAMMLERCAEYHLAAEQIGGTEFPLDEVVRGKGRYRELFLPNMWEANFRRLRRSDPDLFAYVD